MYFLVIIAIMAPLVTTVLTALDKQTTAEIISRTTSLTPARVDSLRWFAITSYQYVGNNVFASATTSTVYWSVIKQTSAVPDSIKNMSIPSTWTIKGNSTQWAVCVGRDDRLTIMSLMDHERISQSKGIVTNMPNVTFGITGEQGAIGFVGTQTSGVTVNVC